MGNVHEASGLRRSRSRRVACVAVAALTGCSTVGQESSITYRAAHMAGTRSVVVARVTGPDGAGDGRLRLAAAELWDLDRGARVWTGREVGPDLEPPPAFAFTPSSEAGAQGWANRDLLPGRYFLRLRAANPAASGGSRDFTFDVPAAGGTFHIGTFHVACAAEGRGCSIAAEPLDETTAAAAMLAAHNPSVGPPQARLARPYPAPLPAGLPPPGRTEIRVDARLWVAAIDWNLLATGTAPPLLPGAAEPRADAAGFADARMVSAANWGDGMEGAGLILVLGVGLAALVVAVPIYLIAREIERDREANRTAAEAQRQAEALRAAALAQEQWGPCAAGIAATLSPDAVERQLRAAFPPPREARGRAAAPGAWSTTVARVIFRHCSDQPDHHGVEVATRWTARRPGEAAADFDVAYTRRVSGATPDRRLVHSQPPPWELPVASEAACRPLAAYCGAEGAALLREEVLRGVMEARDAIAVGR